MIVFSFLRGDASCGELGFHLVVHTVAKITFPLKQILTEQELNVSCISSFQLPVWTGSKGQIGVTFL